MKKRKSFFSFLKKYYNYTMKNFSNEKRKFFEVGERGAPSTRNSRTSDIIIGYVIILGLLLLLFFSNAPLTFQIIMGLASLVVWYMIIYHSTEFTFLYYLFLYLFHYRKIDNEKCSLNELIISENCLFGKNPERVGAVINKYYKTQYCYTYKFSKVVYNLLVREKGKKDRGIIKKLEVQKRAIYFEGEKIFDKLYDLSALDNFLKSTIQDK